MPRRPWDDREDELLKPYLDNRTTAACEAARGVLAREGYPRTARSVEGRLAQLRRLGVENWNWLNDPFLTGRRC